MIRRVTDRAIAARKFRRPRRNDRRPAYWSRYWKDWTRATAEAEHKHLVHGTQTRRQGVSAYRFRKLIMRMGSLRFLAESCYGEIVCSGIHFRGPFVKGAKADFSLSRLFMVISERPFFQGTAL